jgi:hypothetical protein
MFRQRLLGPDIEPVLEELRPGEPPLGPLRLHELSWLGAALTYLALIWQHRGEGIPGSRPFCIFSFEADPGSPYIQFLARSDAELLSCEAVSARSIPEIAAVLRPEAQNLLRDFGFAAPDTSPNYSQRIDVRGTADLAYAARLAYRVLKQVYGITDFGRGSFQFNLSSGRQLSFDELRHLGIDDVVSGVRPDLALPPPDHALTPQGREADARDRLAAWFKDPQAKTSERPNRTGKWRTQEQ